MPVKAAEFRAEVGRFLKLAPDAAYPAPQAAQFKDEDGEEVDFIAAPDLEEIGLRLIQDYEELQHLRELTVIFLWKKEGGAQHDRARLGQCQKAGGLVKYFAEAPWVIWLAADHCETHQLTRQQVEAAMFHELLHAGEAEDKEGNKKAKLIGHDAEMFCGEVKRYGAWKSDLRQAARAFEQGRLFGEA